MMGSVVGQLTNDITGAGGQTRAMGNYAGNIGNIGGIQEQYGQSVLPTALNQYQAGASGQLTPAQQALVTQQLGQAQDKTASEYAHLGLGGSTMQTQDENANTLASLAETANLEAQSEQLGLAGLGAGESFLSGASSSYGGAGQLEYGAGQLAQKQQEDFIKQLTGKSAA